MSKKVIEVKDARVEIYTDKSITNNLEYKEILEEALKSDELKEPKIKELYVFDSSDKGKIHKYDVKYWEDDGVVDVGPYCVNEETLNRILFGQVLCASHPFDFYGASRIFIGFTEEDVRRKVTKYYSGL